MANRFLRFLLVAASLLCFGLIFIVIFINATELDCNRQSDNSYSCRITKLFFGKYKISERVVDKVVSVTMVDDGCSDGCSYRTEFATSDGDQQPFNSVYTDRGPVARQVDAISVQINAGADHIIYLADPPWWVLYLVGSLTLMSLVLSFMFLRKN